MIEKFQLSATVQLTSADKHLNVCEIGDEVDTTFEVDLNSLIGFCLLEVNKNLVAADKQFGPASPRISNVKIVPGVTAYRVVIHCHFNSGEAKSLTLEWESETVQKFNLFAMIVHLAQRAKKIHGDKFQKIIYARIIPLDNDDPTLKHF